MPIPIPVIIASVAVIIVLVILFSGYVKASPDKAYIISGLRKKPKVLIGKAGIKIPFLEKKDELNLQLIPIDVKTSSAVPTADYININVDANVNVKISNQADKLNRAAENFLNKKVDYIAGVAREVLEGNMREIIGQMKLEEMVSDRQKFALLVKENAEPDLAEMGLDIVSFNVQNFMDNEHVIENLGVDNVVKISKNAAISRAVAEKEIAVAQAQAAKESNDAQVVSQTEIAKKQNELAIQKAELQKAADIKKAEADAAYTIQEEEQRKTIETTRANANIARQEREIELKQREAEAKEQELNATIKKQADAEKYATQQKADAELYKTQKASEAELFERQRKAEADKFEAEKSAEAQKAKAEAERFAREQAAEAIKAAGIAEAEAIRAKGEAEARAIQAKAEAEAAGTLKKAEAMKQYGDAARQQMELDTLKVYFEQLPKIAEAVSKGYNSVSDIKMYGGDGAQLTSSIMKSLIQVSDGIKDATGIDINSKLGSFLDKKNSTETAQTSDSKDNDVTVGNYREVETFESTSDDDTDTNSNDVHEDRTPTKRNRK